MKTQTMKISKIESAFYSGFHQYLLNSVDARNVYGSETIEPTLSTFILRAKAFLSHEPVELPESTADDVLRSTVYFINFWNASNPEEKETNYNRLINLAHHDHSIVRFLASCAFCTKPSNENFLAALRLSKGPTPELKLLYAMELCHFDCWPSAVQFWSSHTLENDSRSIYKLVDALISLARGNYQEALSLYSDIEDDYIEEDSIEQSASTIILNDKAVCSMQLKEWNEAQRFLQQAYAVDKQCEATIHNLITWSSWNHDPQNVEKLLYELEVVAPSHPLLLQLQDLNTAFETFES